MTELHCLLVQQQQACTRLARQPYQIPQRQLLRADLKHYGQQALEWYVPSLLLRDELQLTR